MQMQARRLANADECVRMAHRTSKSRRVGDGERYVRNVSHATISRNRRTNY